MNASRDCRHHTKSLFGNTATLERQRNYKAYSHYYTRKEKKSE